jgi:hypothetical protein
MVRQEARHRLVRKILKRHEKLAAEAGQWNRRQKRQRTSPSDHYHISKHPKASYDITAWLSELDGDPAKEVRLRLLFYADSITYLGFRISFRI